jgi:DNA-binding transcriptional LysR family regulator
MPSHGPTRLLIRQGIGVGWLPFSMAYRELGSGQLISLANRFGKEPLEVAIYADTANQMAVSLLDVWTPNTP